MPLPLQPLLPSLPALHDSNFEAGASPRPVQLFSLGLALSIPPRAMGRCRGAGRGVLTLPQSHHLAGTCRPTQIIEERNHGRSETQARMAPAAAPRRPWDAGMGNLTSGAKCTSPCPLCSLWLGNPALLAPAPVGTALLQPSSLRQLQHPQPQAPASHDAPKGT